MDIGRLYHITHVVSDLDAVDRWYDDVFSVRRYYRDYFEPARREASLICIGGVVMEPVMSASVEGAEESAIGKFARRFGQHLHSVAWYIDDQPGTFQQLSKNGVRVYDVAGRLRPEPPRRGALFTHPKDTFGTLEFGMPGRKDFGEDPRFQPGWSPAFWRDEHPLGIERLSHMTTVVRDLTKARAFYADVLDCRLIHEEEVPGRKRSAYFAAGTETVMELAQPLAETSPEGKELAMSGEILHAVTFKVRDLAAAARHLEAKGVRIDTRDGESLVLNVSDTFGVVMGFTQRAIPNDLRA